jgi:hypothetical protein
MTTQVTFKQAVIFGVGFALGSSAATVAIQVAILLAGSLN